MKPTHVWSPDQKRANWPVRRAAQAVARTGHAALPPDNHHHARRAVQLTRPSRAHHCVQARAAAAATTPRVKMERFRIGAGQGTATQWRTFGGWRCNPRSVRLPTDKRTVIDHRPRNTHAHRTVGAPRRREGRRTGTSPPSTRHRFNALANRHSQNRARSAQIARCCTAGGPRPSRLSPCVRKPLWCPQRACEA